MRPRIVLVVALTLALIAVLGGVAYGQILPETPYVSPTDCNSCHGIAGDRSGGPADFSVGAVNLAACAACHANLPGMGHFHRGYSFCRPCHNGSGTLKLLAEPTGVDLLDGPGLNTPNGVFDGAASLTMSATQLHAIHSGANWIESSQGSKTFANYPACSNCHAAAACSACHSDVRPTHDRHATPSYPGVARREATGSSFSTDVVTCVDSACHALPALSTPTCNSCHPESGDVSHQVPHVATEGVTEGISCSACHALDMLSEHAKPTASSSPSGCAACHPTPAATVKPWNQSCATGGCHTQTSNAPMHANTSTKHAVSAENALCLECHAGTELGSIHAGAESKASPGATSCLVCHSASKVPATADCTTCHFTFSAHYDATRHQSASITCGGSGCHDTPGLVSVHSQRNATFGCFGCHNSPRQKVQDAIDAGLTGCDDCHGAVSGLGGHRDAHAAVPPLATGTTPNYSYSSGSRGTAPTGDCAGCHTSNLVDEHMGLTLGATVFFPRFDASGAALTCGTCHDQPAGSTVQNAIAAGLSACESCHPVHAPIQDAHASTFVDTPGSPCADCHDANIANEHNGTYRSAARLTGCGVCHALYSGMTSGPVTGAATQAAISVGNDTRCSACHVAYHTDTTAHTARSAPSQECTTCHDEGGAKTIDVLAIHAGASLGPCKVCHTNPTRVPDITLETAECASCHAEVGVDYHKTMAVNHTFGAMDESCSSGTTCHAAKTLPEEHARFVGVGNKYSEYADSCALCHTNTDPARIPASATADCSSCHEVHGDIDTLHTATGSDGCTRCHDETAPDGFQLSAIHTTNGCSTCHNTTFDLTGKTAECATCHNTGVGGVVFHTSMNVRHIGLGTSGTCEGAGCHTSRDVTDIHARYVGPGKQYSQYADTCALCHLNADAGRINWTVATNGTCVNCHGAPHDRMNHEATSAQSADCAGCHDDWVPETHKANPPSNGTYANCSTCHDNPLKGDLTWDKTTSDCEGCHAKYPAATNHYPADKHLASFEYVCADCHYADVKTEHAKASIDVTCVECHTDPSDKAIIAAGWNKDCSQCHTDMHNDKTTRHASTRSDCSTSGCHVSDVSVIHDGLPQLGCKTCHAGPGQLDTEIKKDCTTSGCHDVYHKDLPGLHKASASATCTRCHPAAKPDGSQLEPLHKGVCAKCHNTTVDTSTKTAECITCHNTTVSPFHGAMAGAHEFTAMNADCTQAGCHVKTLPEEHAKYISRYPAYTDTCALCHLNTVAGRIPADATAACVSCHTVHGDITTIHTATASQSCVACHETGSALDVHLKKDGSGDTDCALCHSASVGRINWDPATVSIECTYCHGPASAKPLDPADHYPTAAHDATAETDCNQCHYKDMKAEHSKPTVSPAVTCVSCHETKVDGFTSAWDKTCAACHTAKHGAQNTKHVSSTTTCSGAGCHVITDVAALHDVAGGPGCGACHAPAAPATTTTCTTAGCHPNVGANHHESHNAAVANPGGCNGCHQLYLDDEHARLGMTCDTCHKSAVPAVVTAIAAGDLRCKSCHPTMHSAQDWEFNPGSASMHRVSSALPGMRTSFPVNGATYTWSLPSASSFLKTGWTTSSVMGCDACHTYTGATGPQGATMKVNMDPAYPTLYSNGILSPSSASGMSTGLICSKCHDLNGSGSSWSNIVHKEHDDRGMSEGGRCVSCHVRIPHGAKRPRLLGASTDPAPYTTVSGGMIEFRLKSYTPNGWQKSDCYAACSTGRHPNQSSPWPAVGGTAPAPSTGVVSGTVTKSTGGALSGATVGMAGKTATSGTGGTYSIADITAGTYTMTISATGYTTWTGQVLITAGGTATQNIALTLTPPVITTGNVSGTVTKSTGGGLSGATVSIGGKTATSGTGGTYSITAITAGTYTMTVSATGYTTWTGQVLITAGGTATQNIALPPVVPTATNIARTGTAGASSQDSYSYGASRAIDGSTSTYWRSNGNGTEWLRVDLGSAKTFDKVVVNWYGSRYARSYRIETSNDGSTWSSRYSTSSGNGDIDTLTFAPISVRYVRVYCTDNNDSDYRITEFEVWGY